MALLLPTPTNLLLPEGTQSFVVEQDLYDICSRIRQEVDGGERLFVVLHEPPTGAPYFTIMERGDDGVERVAIPRIDELDGRVIERLQYILRVPLSQRIDEFEKAEAIAEAKRKENEADELYERLGRPMWGQLEHDGFIQRGVSYAKAGVATRGRKRR